MAAQLDCSYITSCLGIMKILEGICTLAAFACMIDVNYYRDIRESFFLGVNIASFVFVLVWFFCYLFMLCHHFNVANKVIVFVIVHLVWFILLLISGALVASHAAKLSSWVCRNYNVFNCSIYDAAAGFGLIGSFLFLMDAILIWKNMNSVSGTGSRTVTTTRTVVKTTRVV